MKKFQKLALGLTLAVATAMPAAANDAAMCKTYGKFGGAMVDFMLPLTMQNFVDMMTGQKPELLSEMTQSLLTYLDGTDLYNMAQMDGDESDLLGEAAGGVAIELLMSGRATNDQEVITLMEYACLKVGIDAIIDNQRIANKAEAQNLGE